MSDGKTAKMGKPQPPGPQFGRFERVIVINDRRGESYDGREGTVVWRDPPCFNARTGAWGAWAYCVYFEGSGRYRSFRESSLESGGVFDAESNHLGVQHELSFDSAPGDDMTSIEGCYRLPGAFWHVFTFTKSDASEFRHRSGEWGNGIEGVEFEVPEALTLDHDFVIKSLETLIGEGPWRVVQGPDSMILR